MKEKKRMTFVYEGFGFPLTLINAPLRKVFGEWVLDLNLIKLRLLTLQLLIHKPLPLTGAEMRFIRSFLEMSTSDFGKLFGVTHVAVVKWENDQVNINPATEIYIRLHVLNHLKAKDKEFRRLYQEISIEHLAKHKKDRNMPIEIDAEEQLLIA